MKSSLFSFYFSPNTQCLLLTAKLAWRKRRKIKALNGSDVKNTALFVGRITSYLPTPAPAKNWGRQSLL